MQDHPPQAPIFGIAVPIDPFAGAAPESLTIKSTSHGPTYYCSLVLRLYRFTRGHRGQVLGRVGDILSEVL